MLGHSRQLYKSNQEVEWRQLPLVENPLPQLLWICVALENFALIETGDARRVVALSSTSRFTKVGSGDAVDYTIAAKLIDSEARLQVWAESLGIE